MELQLALNAFFLLLPELLLLLLLLPAQGRLLRLLVLPFSLDDSGNADASLVELEELLRLKYSAILVQQAVEL